MVNNSHQYQQSKQTPLQSDGQQFTPISTKQTNTSKKCVFALLILVQLLTITV
jgi:hypothetical protein